MVRVILYRVTGEGEWLEGVVHRFVGENCVVENKSNGELNLVPVKPTHLKFKVLTEEWVRMQVEAQERARSASVLAGVPPGFRR